MRRGPLAIDFADLWREGMKDWTGKLPERMVDDSLEEAFWAQSMAKKQAGKTDPYADEIFAVLSKHIAPHHHVAEIGPGWGNYTFPTLEAAQHVTCIDSSEAVLSYLQMCCGEMLLDNADFVHAKWESYDVPKTYDVIFGVNCFYRMLDIKETLERMNQFATEKAIIGMTSGPIQPHYLALERMGYTIKHPRRDYIDLVNILYGMGIFASVELVPLKRTYVYDTLDELLQKQSVKALDKPFTREDLLTALTPFIEEVDGKWHYPHDFHAALISWIPQN